MSEVARVLNAEDYATGARPYTVERVSESFLDELRRQREPKKAAAGPAPVDPEALKQRQEAAELKAQAVQALKTAQAQAETLLAEAAERAKSDAAQTKTAALLEGRQEGYGAGHTEGHAQGREEGRATYAEALERFTQLFERARDEKAAYFADREALMVELALRVAAKIIHRQVAAREDHIQNLLRQTVQKLADKSKLQVWVHPSDLERLTKAQSEGLLKLQGLKQIEFLADDKIIAGGLRVASGYQTLDAALDSQLAEICRGLLEEAYHDRD